MEITFWGTRGSIPTSGERYVEFGGNTPCLEIDLHSSNEVIVFDAGTGIRELGQDLLGRDTSASKVIHLFLTHAHWDHIQGFPFFTPAYIPGFEVNIYCTKDAKAFLEGQMSPPYFPVGLEVMQGKLDFRILEHSDVVEIGDARITNIPLPHPQGSTGLRVDENGSSLVFATDTEHAISGINERLVEFSRDASALVYDAQYTPSEYEDGKQGWGHSTFEEGVRVTKAACVKKLVLFSHDPLHGDEECRAIEAAAQKLHDDVIAARQGMKLTL